MSYDIYLCDPVSGAVLETDVPHQMAGGMMQIGGTNRLWLNVTYNYWKHYERLLGEGGIRTIYGRSAAETLPVLRDAASKLADDVHDDYWEPSEGNAKRALLQLAAMAQLRPDGVWRGD